MPSTAPKGAPNVLVIMTDDVGFGAGSGFGGPVPTPTFDALAEEGVRYNREDALTPGPHDIALAVRRTGAGAMSGGEMSLSVDGEGVAACNVNRFGLGYGLLFVGRQAYEPLVRSISHSSSRAT